jgi:hypothetical protein
MMAWCSANANRFSLVRPEVESLLSKSRSDDERRGWAFVLAVGIDDQQAEDPSEDLLELFRSSSGVTHAEAAIEIAHHNHASLDEALKTRVIESLIAQMVDHQVPAAERGRVIRAAQFFATSDGELTQALLLLSQPAERWFPGVEGAHYLESSVVIVIDALGQRRSSPAVEQRLTTLAEDISHSDRLTDFDRWLAGNALEWVRKQPAG